MIDLEAIKRYCKAATKGPWYVVGPPWRMSWYDKQRGEHVAVPTYVVAGNPDPQAATVVITAPDCEEEDTRMSYGELVAQTDADLEFAARARGDLPALVSELERVRGTFETLERLRGEGWRVVVKALPDDLPFVIDGARSEYDAPSENQHVGRGKWCCDVSWMRWDNGRYRPGTATFGDTPYEAVSEAARVLQEREVPHAEGTN